MIDLSPPIHFQETMYSGPDLRTGDPPPSKGPGDFAHLLAGLREGGPGQEPAGKGGGEKAPAKPADPSPPAAEGYAAGDKARPLREKDPARNGERPGETLSPVPAGQRPAGEPGAAEKAAAKEVSAKQGAAKQALAKQASLRQAAAERTAADETGEETGSPEALALAGSAAAPALRQAVAAPRQAGDGENPADPALPGEAGADPGAAAQAAGSSTMPSALPSAMPAAGSGRENAPRGVNEKPAQDRKKAAPGDRASLRDLAAIRDPEGFSEQTGKAGDAADGPRGSAETRTRDKRRDRAALEVRDLRTGDAGEGQHAPGPAAGEGPGREIGLSVDLSAAGEARDAPALDEAPQAAGLPDRLGRELREHLRDDIVRNASIVLRDGGEGTIRLALKPESLGNVKIRLEMTENKIAGKITVESEEAFRAFERELRAMERAFRDSGFDGATLEMAVSADGGRGSPGRQGEEGPVPYFSSRFRQGAAYDIVLEPGEGLQALDGSPAGRVRLNMLV